jgi:hypothetical protein
MTCPWCESTDRFHTPSSTCTGLELNGCEPIVRSYLDLARITEDPASRDVIAEQIAGDRRLPMNVAAVLVAEIHGEA